MSRNSFKALLFVASLGFFLTQNLYGKTYKIGTMIPKGTDYAKLLSDMAKEISTKTSGRVKLKFYFGGLAGDEPDVLRKIHVGQLHGGVFTAKAMSDVFSDIRVLEVPFSFKSREQAGEAMQRLESYFSEGFDKNGYQNLGLYEIGEVYLVSRNSTESMTGLKGQKIWVFEGDKLAEAFTKSLNLVAVPVALPDVLTSLSTGLIEVTYAPALAIIALQWQSKVSYIVEQPFGYHFQGFLLSNKAWAKIKTDDQKIVRQVSSQYAKKISETNLSQADDAFEAIKKQGVKPLKWPESDVKALQKARDEIFKSLQGSLLSKSVVKNLEESLKADTK